MSAPARFPSGVTNVTPTDPLKQYGLPDPSAWHTYFNDFDHFAAADWTITTTEAGVGSASEALDDADGGVLLITNDNANDDADFLQKVGESFKMASGKKAVFKARLALGDVDASTAIIGLFITDATPLDATDAIYFKVDDTEGDGTVDFIATSNSAGTSTASDIATLSDGGFVELAFYYDGIDKLEYFVDGDKIGTLPTDNVTGEILTIGFGVQNGAAAAKTLSVDYILAAKER